MVRKIIIFAAICLLTVCATCATVSAEEYSTEYPNIYNSGSPLWLHCEIDGMGEYLIVIDPKTHLQSFGFDGPNRYNLINNTGSTINGRAYSVSSDAAYNARWTSFYKLQLQTGTSSYGQLSYEDYDITAIYGTTLDLIDYYGDRGNDNLSREEMMEGHEYAQTIILVVLCLCLFMRSIFSFTYRSRLCS